MERRREEKKRSNDDPTPKTPAQREPIWSGDSIFKYIPEELRCGVRSVPGGIRLPNLPPIAPRLPPPVAPASIPVGIYRDGVAPQSFKNKTTRNRVGRLVFLSSKPYDEWQIPSLFGEFGETAVDTEVLFAGNYDTTEKRRDAHALIASHQRIACQEQAANHVAAVEAYIRNRRFWEIETLTRLFYEQRPALIFPAPEDTVEELLLDWAPKNDPELGYGIHQPLPTYDLAEFEDVSVAELKGRQTPSSALITRSQSVNLLGGYSTRNPSLNT